MEGRGLVSDHRWCRHKNNWRSCSKTSLCYSCVWLAVWRASLFRRGGGLPESLLCDQWQWLPLGSRCWCSQLQQCLFCLLPCRYPHMQPWLLYWVNINKRSRNDEPIESTYTMKMKTAVQVDKGNKVHEEKPHIKEIHYICYIYHICIVYIVYIWTCDWTESICRPLIPSFMGGGTWSVKGFTPADI